MNKIKTPCEMIIWEILPAIRKRLACVLVEEFKIPQKKVAQILGVSEAAVSQYLKNKRGSKIKFKEKEIEKIRGIAKRIIDKDDKEKIAKNICEICQFIKINKQN